MGEPSSFPPSFKHVPALDGIRGLAILLVLSFHLLWSNSATGSRVLDFFVKVRSSGWVGVDLFFALSGYLITGILLDTRENPRFLRNFYMRRLLRIAPLYYAVLLVLLVAFHPGSWSEARPFALLFSYLQNTSLWWRTPVSGAVANYTLHLWSLAAEEQFYLLWPFVVLLVPNRRVLLWATLTGMALALLSRYLLLAHGATLQATYKLTFCRADSLFAGSCLAIGVRSAFRPAILRLAPYVLGLTTLGCLILAWSTGSFNFETNRSVNLIGYSLTALASASLIALALSPSSSAARTLRAPVLRFFGRYSYGLYVLHQMVAVVVDLHLDPVLHRLFPSKAVFHLASMALVLLITIPLAMLSFHFLERPFLRLKRFFNAHPGTRSAATSPAFRPPEIAPGMRTQP